MKRYAYLSRLEELLADFPQQERRRILQHYEEYFKMEGPDQEEDIAAKLGEPETVAQRIRHERKDLEQSAGIRGKLLLAVSALLLVIVLAVGIGYLSKGWPPATLQIPQTTASVRGERF